MAKIRFTHEEGKQFRVIHADGAFGGPTPTGGICVFFYNQFFPLPSIVGHEFDAEIGKLGQELPEERVSPDGIRRLIEIGVIMDIKTAVSLHEWLGGHIENMKKQSGIDASSAEVK